MNFKDALIAEFSGQRLAENSQQPPPPPPISAENSTPQPVIPLVDFLSLVNKAQRKSLFSSKDLGNLRLVSKQIKTLVDTAFPFEDLSQSDDFEKLSKKPAFTAHVKTLKLTNLMISETGHTRFYSIFTKETANHFINCHFPKLEDLRVSFMGEAAAKILVPYLPNFQFLKKLELHHAYEGDQFTTYHLLAKLPPMDSLKELYLDHNLNMAGGTGTLSTVAQGLANNFPGLTKLDFRLVMIHRGDNLWEMFENVSMPNLEDLTVSVILDYKKNQQPTRQNFDASRAPVWPKLKRLSLLQSDTKFTYEVLHRLPQLSFINHLTSLEINPLFYHKSSVSYPDLLPALSAAGCLEEFICYDWDPHLFSFKDVELPALKKLVLVTYIQIWYEDLVGGKFPALENLELTCRSVVGSGTRTLGEPVENYRNEFSLFPALKSVKISDLRIENTAQFLAPLLNQLHRLELSQLKADGVEKVFAPSIAFSRELGSANEALWLHLTHLVLGGPNIMDQFHVIKNIPRHSPVLKNLEMHFEDRLFKEGDFFGFFSKWKNLAQTGVFNHLENVCCVFDRYHYKEEDFYSVEVWPNFSGKHEKAFWAENSNRCNAATNEDKELGFTSDDFRYLGVDSEDELFDSDEYDSEFENY